MPFDWYQPDVPPTDAATKATRMYELELAERAALLLRLGYTREETTLRLRTNVEWDFEMHRAPVHRERLDAIVDNVYQRRGMSGGGPPTLEP